MVFLGPSIVSLNTNKSSSSSPSKVFLDTLGRAQVWIRARTVRFQASTLLLRRSLVRCKKRLEFCCPASVHLLVRTKL